MEMNWTDDKPARPGAYWVRGHRIELKCKVNALVEVREIEGVISCNLHRVNTNNRDREFFPVAQCSDRFQWCGPLVPAIPGSQAP